MRFIKKVAKWRTSTAFAILCVCVCTWGSLFSFIVGFTGISTKKDSTLKLGRLGMFLKNWGWFQNAIILLVQIKHDISYNSTSRRNFYIVHKTLESLQPSAGSQSRWNTSCSEEQRLVKRMKCLKLHFLKKWLFFASLHWFSVRWIDCYCIMSNSWIMIMKILFFGELEEKMNTIFLHTWGIKALVERNLSHRDPWCTLQ